jgi:polyisoprenoid-binding protein YceI
MRRRGLVISAVTVSGLVVIGGAALLLLNSHHAPSALALSTPTPARAQGDLTGNWKVTTGSEAGYRVREQFINQPAPTEAVARTTKVSGGLKVTGGGGSPLTVTGIHLTVDLTTLQSQDKYATFQTYQRDFFIRQIYLETDTYPIADFKADSVTVPAGVGSGPVSLAVTGSLAVHGVTKMVTTQLQAQQNGDRIEVAGSITVDMRDFNVAPPDISFTKAEPGVVIEYHLLLVRG